MAWCPKCGRRLPEGTCEGYGLAHGGGIGHYQYCSNPKCDWFYKMLDADETGGENETHRPDRQGIEELRDQYRLELRNEIRHQHLSGECGESSCLPSMMFWPVDLMEEREQC